MPDIVDGLRELADWLEQHPKYADQLSNDFMGPYRFDLFFDTKDELVEFKRASGAHRVDKQATGGYFWLRRDFGGGIVVDANVPREEACRKIVTGTREIPEEIIPARVEEIVDWECHSIFAEAD